MQLNIKFPLQVAPVSAKAIIVKEDKKLPQKGKGKKK